MEKINETISRLNSYIKDVENEVKKVSDQLSEENKKHVETLASKTVETITSSINKLNELKETVSDEEQIKDFLLRLDDKCKDISEYTKTKIMEILPAEDTAEEKAEDTAVLENETNEDTLVFKLSDTLDKAMENPSVKGVVNFVKDTTAKAVDFYNKEETQTAINNAKLKTIDLAEKGLAKLKKSLGRE